MKALRKLPDIGRKIRVLAIHPEDRCPNVKVGNEVEVRLVSYVHGYTDRIYLESTDDIMAPNGTWITDWEYADEPDKAHAWTAECSRCDWRGSFDGLRKENGVPICPIPICQCVVRLSRSGEVVSTANSAKRDEALMRATQAENKAANLSRELCDAVRWRDEANARRAKAESEQKFEMVARRKTELERDRLSDRLENAHNKIARLEKVIEAARVYRNETERLISYWETPVELAHIVHVHIGARLTFDEASAALGAGSDSPPSPENTFDGSARISVQSGARDGGGSSALETLEQSQVTRKEFDSLAFSVDECMHRLGRRLDRERELNQKHACRLDAIEQSPAIWDAIKALSKRVVELEGANQPVPKEYRSGPKRCSCGLLESERPLGITCPSREWVCMPKFDETPGVRVSAAARSEIIDGLREAKAEARANPKLQEKVDANPSEFLPAGRVARGETIETLLRREDGAATGIEYLNNPVMWGAEKADEAPNLPLREDLGKYCLCYDDGVMPVTHSDCPVHRPKKAVKP